MPFGQFLLNQLHGVQVVAQHATERRKHALQKLGQQFALKNRRTKKSQNTRMTETSTMTANASTEHTIKVFISSRYDHWSH